MSLDDHRPPDRALVDDCVHCGFCLPSCPTYALWGQEMDSPRGRIHLMAQALDGAPLAGPVTAHIDSCLSCLGCLTSCPSGVKYDHLVTATRAQIERQVRRPPGERAARALIFGLFPHPRRLRVARAALAAAEASGLRRVLRNPSVAAHLPALVRAMEAVAPPPSAYQRLGRRVPARGPWRGTVAMLTGCVQSVFFSSVNAATARVLAAEGFDVEIPRPQGCCGALSGHVGREEEAIRYAKATIDVFSASGAGTVVVNAAGCGSAMKEYGHLLSDDAGYARRAQQFAAQVRDLSEFLVEVGPRAHRHPVPATVAYHDACHLAHAQRVRDAPRALLDAIPGLERREIAEGQLCCGSAGVYNLLQPGPAGELGDRKAANVRATGADALVSANPGCTMQIRAAAERAGWSIATYHIAEVLDASVRGARLGDGLGQWRTASGAPG
ncbi:MAG: (Fe-S)-binding protein [Acidimicrobiales bacterium]|jgi:glycolate oxidase iron-sulfur subunit